MATIRPTPALKKQKLVSLCCIGGKETTLPTLIHPIQSSRTNTSMQIKTPINNVNILMVEIYPDVKEKPDMFQPCSKLHFCCLCCEINSTAEDIPLSFQADYPVVQSVDFTGHIGSMRLAFDILKYLKKLREVVYVINDYNIKFPHGYRQTFEGICQHIGVETVKIVHDLSVLEKSNIDIMDSQEWRLDEFLEGCEKCFPNLKKIEVSVHATGRTYELVKSFIAKNEKFSSLYTVEIHNEKVKTILRHPSHHHHPRHAPRHKALLAPHSSAFSQVGIGCSSLNTLALREPNMSHTALMIPGGVDLSIVKQEKITNDSPTILSLPTHEQHASAGAVIDYSTSRSSSSLQQSSNHSFVSTKNLLRKAIGYGNNTVDELSAREASSALERVVHSYANENRNASLSQERARLERRSTSDSAISISDTTSDYASLSRPLRSISSSGFGSSDNDRQSNTYTPLEQVIETGTTPSDTVFSDNENDLRERFPIHNSRNPSPPPSSSQPTIEEPQYSMQSQNLQTSNIGTQEHQRSLRAVPSPPNISNSLKKYEDGEVSSDISREDSVCQSQRRGKRQEDPRRKFYTEDHKLSESGLKHRRYSRYNQSPTYRRSRSRSRSSSYSRRRSRSRSSSYSRRRSRSRSRSSTGSPPRRSRRTSRSYERRESWKSDERRYYSDRKYRRKSRSRSYSPDYSGKGRGNYRGNSYDPRRGSNRPPYRGRVRGRGRGRGITRGFRPRGRGRGYMPRGGYTPSETYNQHEYDNNESQEHKNEENWEDETSGVATPCQDEA